MTTIQHPTLEKRCSDKKKTLSSFEDLGEAKSDRKRFEECEEESFVPGEEDEGFLENQKSLRRSRRQRGRKELREAS